MMTYNSYSYSWDALVERKKGEAVRSAVRELGTWAEETRLPKDVADWAKFLARSIHVITPEEVDDVIGWDLAPDGTKVPGTEFTWREAYPNPEMSPAEGQAVAYISDMSLDLPQEVFSKAAELFDKHGVLDVWSSILQDGYDGLTKISISSQLSFYTCYD